MSSILYQLMSSSSSSRKAQTHGQQIDKWNNANNTNVSYSMTSSVINLNNNGYTFKITYPKSIGDFFIVESLNEEFDWVDELNLSIIDNNMELFDILTHIHNRVKSLVTKQNIKEKQTEYKINDSTINIDNLDLDFYRKKKELDSYIDTSKNPFDSSTATASNTTRLFNATDLPKIVIEEFMRNWKRLQGSEKMSINLVGNNIYNWSIKYYKFAKNTLNKELEEINKQYGYNYIELQLSLHSLMYPNYPPVIKITRPRLTNSLMHRIANTRMIRLDYWTPSRDTWYIINKVYNLLDGHASIQINTEMNDIVKYPDGSFFKLENHLVRLASFIDSGKDNDIDDQKYEKVNLKQKDDAKYNSNESNRKYWAAGTGYGHNGCSKWDVNAYVKAQNERDRQAKKILNEITIEIQDTKTDVGIVYNSIQHSLLIPYLKTTLNGITLLEMSKHQEVYRIIFNLLALIANENGVFLFHDNSDKSLFKILNELNTVGETALKLDKNNVDDIVHNIIGVFSMLKPTYEEYLTRMNKLEEKKKSIVKVTDDNSNAEHKRYVNMLGDLKFDTANIVGENYAWLTNLNNDRNTKITYQKRMVQEFTALQQSLPIHYEASIFVRYDSQHMSVVRALITGPKDTPYENGCFIFDIYIPINYPNSPPKVWYITHGGKRFNPNLYESGKVCLSLIGTWEGDHGAESWNAKTSTLYQVLVSIQGQILTENPYFNEPGHEAYFGSKSGDHYNNAYNNNIRYYTMCHTIRDLLKQPDAYPQFAEVIRRHFYLKKQKILEVCAKWVKDTENAQFLQYASIMGATYNNTHYRQIYNEIEDLLNKLTL